MTKLLESGSQSLPTALVKTVIKNTYIDRYRREQKYTHIEYSELNKELDVVSIEHPNLEDILVSESEFNYCWKILSVDERELIFNHTIEGQTAQEIADAQNTSRGTVLSRIHRLKLRLKAHLLKLRKHNNQNCAAYSNGENQ